MRVPTLALPFAAAAAGFLLAGGLGLVVGLGAWLCGSRERAFSLLPWCSAAGALAGGITGLCRALDRWWNEPEGGDHFPSPGPAASGLCRDFTIKRVVFLDDSPEEPTDLVPRKDDAARN
jgi:hypothetical protein